jgi:hypothetical protein
VAGFEDDDEDENEAPHEVKELDTPQDPGRTVAVTDKFADL